MPSEIFPMIVMVTAILTTGGVLVFRPLSKRLGHLLEVMAQDRLKGNQTAELARMREVVVNLENRLALLEERQDFAEALISSGEPRTLSAQHSASLSEPN